MDDDVSSDEEEVVAPVLVELELVELQPSSESEQAGEDRSMERGAQEGLQFNLYPVVIMPCIMMPEI